MADTNTLPLKPKPKSREPFYSVSPHWTDIIPIPLVEGPPLDPNAPTGTAPAPALATIAYSARYSEAMSYLRAVMANNEFSLRSIALTEDIIGMNPAHYTVWLFRMKCLKVLWEAEGGDGLEKGVQKELEWLEGVSERNLKNYQIWHHRQTLLTLYPLLTLPPTEIPFLTHILSFDTKNYHVWTYRQWLCRRYPDPLLITSCELDDVEKLLIEDVRNNSAWNHRYFVVFGAEELKAIEEGNDTRNRKEAFAGSGGGVKGLIVDEEVVEREIAYSQAKIELAPQNPSPWNYLKGVMRRAGRDTGEMKAFCERFVGGEGADLWGEQVRSSHAIDWLAEIYGAKGDLDGAGTCLRALGEKWDPIRRKYWEYRAKKPVEQ